MNKFITLILCALITGCSLYTPRGMVAVPVTIAPKLMIPKKPKLSISTITDKSKPMDIEKAQVKDLDALMVYSAQLIKLIESLNI